MYLFCRKLGFCLQGHMYINNYDKPFGLLKDLLIICLIDSFLIHIQEISLFLASTLLS